MGQVISSVLNWVFCGYHKRRSSSPKLSDPLCPQQTNAVDHVITIVDDVVEAFDDRHQSEYWSIVVDPDRDFSNQDQNRGEFVTYEVDFEDQAFDDQALLPSSSSSSSEEQSPHGSVDDPSKEINPLSIVVDNWKEPITVDVISPPVEKKKSDFEAEAFDDNQVFIPSSYSPDSFVDNQSTEVNPLSSVVDNRQESLPLSGIFDFSEWEKYFLDAISPPIEEKKKKSDVIKEEIWMKHYCCSHKILLVGEGDFSFSACLASAFGRADNMVATSLNSQAFLKKNYGKAMSNINSLRNRGCKVIHKVDATVMAGYDYLLGVKYDRIVYNFPHAGFLNNESANDQVKRHQNLVRLFMANAKKMVAETGEIHISHKCNRFFQQWGIQKLAKKNGFVLIEEVKFNLSDYPGYNTKYGYGGDKNFNCNPSKTYKFRLKKRVSE